MEPEPPRAGADPSSTPSVEGPDPEAPLLLARDLAAEGDVAGALRSIDALHGVGAPGTPLEPDVVAVEKARIAADARLTNLARKILEPIASAHGRASGVAQIYIGMIGDREREAEEDRRLHELQRDYLEERTRTDRADDRTYSRLALLTLEVGRADGMGSRMPEALQVLDEGVRRFPDSARLLEDLARLHEYAGDSAPWETALRRLEAVDAESSYLRSVGEVDARSAAAGGADENSLALADYLLDLTMSNDQSLAEAAVADLTAMSSESPRSAFLRVMLAHALESVGRRDEALRQGRLASDAADDHATHFNLVSLYWRLHRRDEAEAHARRARDLALTQQDRQDVADLMADLMADSRPRDERR
jgi:tetratricopeptide (TPR) repeat protein